MDHHAFKHAAWSALCRLISGAQLEYKACFQWTCHMGQTVHTRRPSLLSTACQAERLSTINCSPGVWLRFSVGCSQDICECAIREKIMYCSRHMYDGLPQSASPCLALPHLDQSKYTVRIYVQYVCTFTAAHTGRHTCRITGTCAGHGLASQVVRGSTKRSCRTECKGGKAVWRHVTRYQICVRPGTTAGGTCRG